MSAINAVTELTREGDIGVLTINAPPVNALSRSVREGIFEGMAQAQADPDLKAIVLICAGRTFIAGADITEFGKPSAGISLPQVHEALEFSAKPVIAALHGTALGGGLETALVCHYRIGVPSVKCGLPEIKLGLIPGAGGTVRMTRLAGPQQALDMIVSGAPIGGKAALEIGILDEMATEGALRSDAIAFARRVVSEGRELRRIRDLEDKITSARGNHDLFETFRKDNARKYRGFEAWLKAVQSVENAVNLSFDEALAQERALFISLRDSCQSAAQRHVFLAEREAAKIPDIAANTPTRPLEHIGIIGAGTMGGGIAMNFLNAGLPVTIIETQADALERGIATIRSNYESTAKKGRIRMEDVEARLALLTGSLDFAALADCDLVIEAAFETMEVKLDIFSRLDAIAKPGAILASNTSYLDLDAIARATARPQDVVGLHFFSPANVMKLLEIVRGAATAGDVIATAMGLARRIGKIGVQVGVCHGFVGNRMLAQRQREANRLILEGAMPWDVDRVLYGFGLPMGPFAMSDLAGLDLGWNRATSTSSTMKEILCEMDRRGQKTGAGFYDYDAARNALPSPLVEQAVLDLAARQGLVRRAISDEEILQRCIYPMINEGAKILEEGIALRASDIDVVWINGYGWPVTTGGPMFYGETVGLAHVLEVMQGFEARLGPQFQPASLLVRLVREGKGFGDDSGIKTSGVLPSR